MCKRLSSKPIIVRGAVKTGKPFTHIFYEGTCTFYLFAVCGKYFLGIDDETYRFSLRISRRKYLELYSIVSK